MEFQLFLEAQGGAFIKTETVKVFFNPPQHLCCENLDLHLSIPVSLSRVCTCVCACQIFIGWVIWETGQDRASSTKCILGSNLGELQNRDQKLLGIILPVCLGFGQGMLPEEQDLDSKVDRTLMKPGAGGCLLIRLLAPRQ